MSTGLHHALLGAVPLLVTAVLALMTLTKKSPHPASYKLGDKWTYGPILWAAVDERIGDAHGHGADEFTVGGGASGKW